MNPQKAFPPSPLVTSDGLSLHRRSWPANPENHGIIAFMHGYAEHSGRYEHVGAFFSKQGFAFHAVDLRGHGQSSGPRVNVRRFEDYINDAALFCQILRQEHPGLPLFLYGHSMGSIIVLLTALWRDIQPAGVVIASAPLKVPQYVGWWKLLLVRLAGKIWPGMPIEKRIDSSLLSRNASVVQSYVNDPLNYQGPWKARLGLSLLLAVRDARAQAHQFQCPLLVLHGQDDAIAEPTGSIWFEQNAASPDKTLKIYPGLYHELHNEPEWHTVLADAAQWMRRRCGSIS
mgnify:CR=1 FL=1